MKNIEFKIKSKTGRDFLADATFDAKQINLPIVIFCHGFKGFKDWGNWDLVANEFAKEGFCFIKFNFSFNGIGLCDNKNFTLLDEFRKNTISKELLDIESVLDFVYKSDELKEYVDVNNINLIGHSRGAATAFIAASMSKKFNKIAGWAGVYDLLNWVNKYDVKKWEEDGSLAFQNTRTKQEIKVDFSCAKEIIDGEYTPSKYLIKIEIPILLVHGEKDEAVSYLESKTVYGNILHSIYIPVEEAGHTFGIKHPGENKLPASMQEVLENTIEFFKD
jgi:pimeloyl-ACP methyl ester carboxylesterase